MKLNFCTDRVNLLKAETEDYYEIEGLASTPDLDLQEEIVDQDGLDFSEIEYINADHGHQYKDKPGGKDLARMGLIDEAKMTKKGLWIKGKVWKKHPEAAIYANELKYGKPGLVQFSIEGSIISRDPFQRGRVRKAKVKGIALTRNAVNPNTYARLVKSLTSEQEIVSTEQCTLDQKYEILEQRYEALAKGHAELSEQIQYFKSELSKSEDENFKLKKEVVLGNGEAVRGLIKSRIKEDKDFRSKLKTIIEKALAPGGPQHTNPPNTITGGGVFMTESNENSERKKKKKKKKNKETLKKVSI